MGQRTKVLVSSLAVALQGPFLSFLSRQSLYGYLALSVASVTLAVALAAFLGRRNVQARGWERVLMASVGTLAMLFGWFADAGFRPLVGNGVCLCGCTDSLTGLGLVLRPHWMQGSMLAACAAVALLAGPERPSVSGPGQSALNVVVSSVLMLAGMAAAGWAMGSLRLQDQGASVFASYVAMSAGMIAGAQFAGRLKPGVPRTLTSNETSFHGRWAPRSAAK